MVRGRCGLSTIRDGKIEAHRATTREGRRPRSRRAVGVGDVGGERRAVGPGTSARNKRERPGLAATTCRTERTPTGPEQQVYKGAEAARWDLSQRMVGSVGRTGNWRSDLFHDAGDRVVVLVQPSVPARNRPECPLTCFRPGLDLRKARGPAWRMYPTLARPSKPPGCRIRRCRPLRSRSRLRHVAGAIGPRACAQVPQRCACPLRLPSVVVVLEELVGGRVDGRRFGRRVVFQLSSSLR